MKIVVVEEKAIICHEYEIAENTTEAQLDLLAEKLSKLDHPGDIFSAFTDCGITATSRSCDEGDWQSSEIEYCDEYETQEKSSLPPPSKAR